MTRVYSRDQLAEAPDWVEIDDFEIFTLDQGEPGEGRRTIPWDPGSHAVVAVVSGEVTAQFADGKVTLQRRDWLSVPESGLRLTSMRSGTSKHFACELVLVRGHWDAVNEVGSFQFRPEKPLEYHYHDYNEYWIVYRGSATVQLPGEEIVVKAGQVLANPVGWEHGIRAPHETIEGLGFQTQAVGQRRQGHLLRDVHGEPVPAAV